MGEVTNEFMLRRVPVRYVEILKTQGEPAAKMWWRTLAWAPANSEETNRINMKIIELINS